MGALPSQYQRCHQSLTAQGTNKGRGLPVAAGCLCKATSSLQGASIQPCHAGIGTGFIQKHQVCHIQACLLIYPCLSGLGNIGSLLLGRMECLFFSVNPSRLSILCMVVMPVDTSCSSFTHWHNSMSVISGLALTLANSTSYSPDNFSGIWLCWPLGRISPNCR